MKVTKAKLRLAERLRAEGKVKPCCTDPENYDGPHPSENPDCVIYTCKECGCRKWVVDGKKAFGKALALK